MLFRAESEGHTSCVTTFEWILVAGVVLGFLALLSWTGASLGSWLVDLLVALLAVDEDDLARWLWWLALILLVVGSVGRLATEGV